MQTDLMQKAKTYRWVIFTVLAFGYILVYFHRLCPAVLAVDVIDHTSTALPDGRALLAGDAFAGVE